MNRTWLSAYGLKWNPFAPEVPAEALWVAPAVESFLWRVENLAQEGGFALLHGDPGSGKSTALRILVTRLSRLSDLKVGILTRPQSGMADFYREMGELFGVELAPHNRWAGSKVLRQRWVAHIQGALFRPVLVVDEAQEMMPNVFNELRLLSSSELDSRLLLTVVLAGDNRLLQKLRQNELLPLDSRIRTRLPMNPAKPQELRECLQHLLGESGNAVLMSDALVQALCEHAMGNFRLLMTMAGELLALAVQRELHQLDEQLFFEQFQTQPSPRGSRPPNSPSRNRSRS